jgi:heme a synthase
MLKPRESLAGDGHRDGPSSGQVPRGSRPAGRLSQPVAAEAAGQATGAVAAAGQRWVQRLAITMTLLTFPLIWLGGLVTTQGAGMAVPDWPGTYGYNLFLYPWQAWIYGPFDLLVEHGHRLLAALVGMVAIGLAVVATYTESRRWMVYWCWGMLAAVIAQGALGGARVVLDQRTLAMLHGCTGPLFFALSVLTVAFGSRWWLTASPVPVRLAVGGWWWRAAAGLLLLTGLLYVQLVIGARLRHIPLVTPPSGFTFWVHLHLSLAAVITLWIGSLLAVDGWRGGRRTSAATRPSRRCTVAPCAARQPELWLLAPLVAMQLCLGVGSWFSKYALPWDELTGWLARYTLQAQGWWESLIVTGHQATGSLLLVTAVWLTARRLRMADGCGEQLESGVSTESVA